MSLHQNTLMRYTHTDRNITFIVSGKALTGDYVLLLSFQGGWVLPTAPFAGLMRLVGVLPLANTGRSNYNEERYWMLGIQWFPTTYLQQIIGLPIERSHCLVVITCDFFICSIAVLSRSHRFELCIDYSRALFKIVHPRNIMPVTYYTILYYIINIK